MTGLGALSRLKDGLDRQSWREEGNEVSYSCDVRLKESFGGEIGLTRSYMKWGRGEEDDRRLAQGWSNA